MAQVYFRCHSRATPTSLSHFGPNRGPDQSATSCSGAKRTQTHRLRHTQNPVEGVLALAAAKPDRTPGRDLVNTPRTFRFYLCFLRNLGVVETGE